MEIREMKPSDYPLVLALWNNELGSRLTLEQFTARTRRMNQNEDYRTFVAVLDGEAAGFITTVKVMAVEYERGYLKINGLAVKKEFQNRGIGTALLAHAENYAKAYGLSRFILNSGFQRAGAHAFYQRKGFDKKSYCFTKKIVPPH